MNALDEQYTQAKILHYPDERLLKPSMPVVDLDETTVKEAILLERMLLDLQTIGLSAPQIDIHKRMFVLKRNGKVFHLINPEITWARGRQFYYEGCSSLPGKIFKTQRSAEIVIDALDIGGQQISFLLDGQLCHVALHQVDHLNGILVNTRGELLSEDAA